MSWPKTPEQHGHAKLGDKPATAERPIMTNQEAPEALRPIQRYKIGYHSDEWGMRSSTPGGVSDPSGQWVLYKDHIAALHRLHAENAALRTQQPAPATQQVGEVVAYLDIGAGGYLDLGVRTL